MLNKLFYLLMVIFVWAPYTYASSLHSGLPPQFIDFTGKLDNSTPELNLNSNDFVRLENFNYHDKGIETRGGITTWSTDNESDEIISIISWDHENDGQRIIAAAVDPVNGVTYYSVEDKAFGSTALYQSKSATTAYPITWAVVRDSLVIGDSSGLTVWGGTSTYPTALLVEYTTGVYTDLYDWIHSGNSEHVPDGAVFYIGYSRPFDAVQADQNSSSWDTGFPSSVTPEMIGGKYRYWATITCTSGGSFIQYPKINTSPRPLGAFWDGQDWQYAGGAGVHLSGASEFQDHSLLLADSSEETYMDVGGLESGGTIAFGFFERPRWVRIRLDSDYVNESASIPTFLYYNGQYDKVVSGTTADGTGHNGIFLAQTGFWELPKLTDWEKKTYGGVEYPLYWLFAKTNATIDDYVRIYSVNAIPETDSPNDKHYKGVVAYKNRVFLYNGDDKARVLMSAYGQPDVYTGDDAFSETDDFRIGKQEKVMAAVPAESGLFWLKKTENYFMGGYNRATIAENVVQLENTAPCASPESARLVRKGGQEFIIYQAYDGVYHLPAVEEEACLSKDIEAFFTPGNSLCIPNGWIDKSRAFYDKKESKYSLFVAAGSGATQFTHRLVLDLDRFKWSVYTYDNNVELSTIAALIDEDNQYVRLGGSYNGYIYDVDRKNCYDDAGYDIISVWERPFTVLSSRISINNSTVAPRYGTKHELRALSFQYNLLDPSVSNLTGNTIYVTTDLSNGATESQTSATLSDNGFKYNYPEGSLIAHYHKLKMRLTGPVNFFQQVIWSRERGFRHAGSFLLLADASRRIFLEDGNGNAILWY